MIFLLSWYFVTSWRTTEFGVSVGNIGGQLLTALISIFPLSLMGLLFLKLARYDLSVKIFIRQILIIAVMVVVLSEVWASSEEYLFKRKCAGNTSEISQSRWWPFTNSHFGYSKEGGFYAGD